MVAGRIYQLAHFNSDANKETNGLEICMAHDGIRIGSLKGLLLELQTGSINRVITYTHSPSASLLATKSRQSDLYGPDLQNIHADIGSFLADKLVDEFDFNSNILTHKVECPHVQGNTFTGVESVSEILILPLMRGGEPMSRGVHSRFPRAHIFHYLDKKDDNANCGQRENFEKKCSSYHQKKL